MSRVSDVRTATPVEFTLPGGCQCQGQPHPEGDVVYFRPRLDTVGGLAAAGFVKSYQADRLELSGLQKELGYLFLLHGVVGWNFLDDKGKPIPVTEDAIRYGLDWNDTAEPLAEFADDLYADEVFNPFLARQTATSSPGGPTAKRTSPTPISRGRRRSPSAPSSRRASAGSRR